MTERELVETFKSLRSEFLWRDIQQIAVYMRLELKYTKILMEALRESFRTAGYVPRSWHGPGAVARLAIRRHGVYDAMATSPSPVAEAARYAFIGGRFEQFIAGHIGPVYSADINSAYPWFASKLPNLARGTWRHTSQFEDGKFGIYHIRYECSPDSYGSYPLPYRSKNGSVSWPHRVTSWYWNPEASLVKNDPHAEFLEGWVFDEDDESDRPFAWIAEMYHQRRVWKDADNPAEYCLKLIINSIYGQLAQRTGWDQKKRLPPKCHQLEWAGWITSSCRAAVFTVARSCGDDLVSIDTDGVFSRRPFRDLDNSKIFGGWELKTYDDSIFWQSGIYMLKKGDEWVKAKSRGIPRGSYDASQLLSAMESSDSLKLTKKVFISYGLALQGRRAELNTWKEEPHEYEFGGSGKRYHYTGGNARSVTCRDICGESGTHRLAVPTYRYGPDTDPHSYPHKLPWLVPEEDMSKIRWVDDLFLFDANHLDYDEEWTRNGG
jgi:hypothetical protein